ncbi:MAG: hypothetical protein WBB94_04840 [Candidatus Saccharimonadaceae bacterium]
MARLKMGLDIRSNWLHYDRSLLRADKIDPDQLRSILTLGSRSIIDAMETMHQKPVANNPPGADIQYPWLFTIKLADYLHPLEVFTDEAMQIVQAKNANPNNNYPMEQLLPWVHPYFDAASDAGFIPRVPGRMNGWDDEHDGVWFQVRHITQAEPTSDTHTHQIKRWPTRQELEE